MRPAKRAALAVLLSFGAADLLVLNLGVLPPLLAQNEVASSQNSAPSVLPPVHQPIERPTPSRAAVTAAENVTPGAVAALPLVAAEPEPTVSGRLARQIRERVVRFRPGALWVAAADKQHIARLGGALSAVPIGVVVEGHADASGSAAVNRRISRARAEAIADLLVLAGVDRGRITVRAFGADRPSGTGEDRRVELRLGGRL